MSWTCPSWPETPKAGQRSCLSLLKRCCYGLPCRSRETITKLDASGKGKELNRLAKPATANHRVQQKSGEAHIGASPCCFMIRIVIVSG